MIGGLGVSDAITIQGTSGNGTSTGVAINFAVGNAGATSALSILNNGSWTIMGTAPSSGQAPYYNGTSMAWYTPVTLGGTNAWTGNNSFAATVTLTGGANFGSASANFTNTGHVSGISAGTFTAARTYTLPDKSGTFAMISDIGAGSIGGSGASSPGTGAGSSPIASVFVTTNGLQYNLLTGSGPAANAVITTILLGASMVGTAYPVLSPGNAAAAALTGIYAASSSSSQFTINSGSAALAAGVTYVWNIQV